MGWKERGKINTPRQLVRRRSLSSSSLMMERRGRSYPHKSSSNRRSFCCIDALAIGSAYAQVLRREQQQLTFHVFDGSHNSATITPSSNTDASLMTSILISPVVKSSPFAQFIFEGDSDDEQEDERETLQWKD